MEWDLTLEKLRQEAFRPSIPPPVRMPRWAVAALVGAGLTLSGTACDRGGAAKTEPASDPVVMGADAGAVMPPQTEAMPSQPEPTLVENPVVPPPDAGLKPLETPPPMLEEMKEAPVKLPISVPDYGSPVMGRPQEPPSLPAPMYGGPGLNGRPTVSATGLVPSDAPQDVRKILQGFPYVIGSCYQQEARRGPIDKSGDLMVTVSVSGGLLTVTDLGGSLANTADFASCVKARLNRRKMGSSEEAISYTKNWKFHVMMVTASE